MGYTDTQKRNMCCGYFCGLTACVGVYFFLVICFFEANNNTYLTEETQGISNPFDPTVKAEGLVRNFVSAFGYCALVSDIS
jgi:hypothetical protein